MRRLLTNALLCCSLAALVGGCVNRYTVVRQDAVNPVAPPNRLLLEPIHFETLTIDGLPETDWRARRTPQQNASFDGDKHLMIARFADRLVKRAQARGIALAASPDEGTIILRPVLHSVTMGYYGFIVGDDTIADMDVQLVDPQGRVLDQIAVHSAGKADESGITFTARLGKAADKAADLCASYLAERAAAARATTLARSDRKSDSAD